MQCVAGPNKSRHITHERHTRSGQDDVRAAKHIKLSPFSTSLEPSFSDTRGSLNFLIVHSCSQNLPLISCISAYKFQRRITLLGLISITGVKQLRALLAKKMSTTTPTFLHVFGRATSDLQLCFVQLKTLAPSARYSTFKYPLTLKLGLRVTQGHRKLYHSMRHP